MDVFREVSSQGWLSRIGSSFGGMIAGVALFFICIGVLFWNEGRAVKEAKRIDEGKSACVSVDAAKVDPANEKKEIHISGDATTIDKPTDEVFNLSAPAIRLKRTVEMYQWKESRETKTRKKIGGGEEKETTYSYTKTWDDDVRDSSDFKHPEDHRNPDRKPYENAIHNASNVTVGAFELSPRLVGEMESYEPLALSADKIALPAAIKSTAKFSNGGLYLGDDPAAPAVGDARVRFDIVKPGPVSVVGQQVGNTFQPFVTAHGETLMLADGIVPAEQMFEAAKSRNAILTWILRGVGFVVMWIGLIMLVRPLRVLGDVLPFLGDIVGFASALIMFLVAAAVSSITIGIAWLVYRPLLGITMLIVAAGLIALIVRSRRRSRPAMQGFPNMPPPPIPS